MKKFTLFTALLACSFSIVYATTITVRVSNFQFSPKTVNAKVGDTIKWLWKNGIHTTTSVTIPAGAPTWNKNMDSAHLNFKYRLRVAGTYQYKCTPHGSIGMTGTIKVTNTLAAGLSDFVMSGDDLQTILNWKTKSSVDVAYFSVQRSVDGNDFKEIKRIIPSATNSYNYSDKEATGKYVYYQLRMVDKTGAEELTSIHMRTRNVPAEKLITSLSPNPVTKEGHLLMQFNSDIEGSMRVQLFTQTGRLMKEVQMSATKGVNNGHLHMGDMPTGTYYIVCTLGTKTEKYTVLKN